jgi:lipoyl(octanoyl) transferase
MNSVQSVKSEPFGRSHPVAAGQAVFLPNLKYGVAWKLQQLLCEARHHNDIPDTLLLCEHDHVITMGRRKDSPKHILFPRFPVYAIERGGDVTYHGPGQLVGYPILALRKAVSDEYPFGEQDLTAYLRALEQGLLLLLAQVGVSAARKPQHTGIWTADQAFKIASLGVAVRRFVTLHGFALNVTTDLACFSAISPCGLSSMVMRSLSSLGFSDLTVAGLVPACAEALGTALGRSFPLKTLEESGLSPYLTQAQTHPEPPQTP